MAQIIEMLRIFARQFSFAGVTNRSTMASRILDESASRELVRSVESFLFDCDGVLWDGNGIIPGSLETVTELKKQGKTIFYVTNNSSKSRAEYVEKCRAYGFDAKEDEIVCTAFMAAAYLNNIGFSGKVYVVGNPAMGEELDKFNIKHTGIGPDAVEGFVDEWIKIQLDPEVSCVLVGFDKHLSFPKILKAASYLKRENCLFIATNQDGFLPSGGDIVIPGTGTMVNSVMCPSQRTPIIVGKPETTMFDTLRKVHGLDPSRCCMVGDSLHTDIAMAKKCEMKSLLVLTGVCTQVQLDDLNQETNDQEIIKNRPDFYSACLGDLGKHITS